MSEGRGDEIVLEDNSDILTHEKMNLYDWDSAGIPCLETNGIHDSKEGNKEMDVLDSLREARSCSWYDRFLHKW